MLGVVVIVGVVGEVTVARVAGCGGKEGEVGKGGAATAAVAVADCNVSIREINEGDGDGIGEVGVDVKWRSRELTLVDSLSELRSCLSCCLCCSS